MSKIFFAIVFLFILQTGLVYSQDSLESKPPAKEIICRKWALSEYRENGETAKSPAIYLIFKNDGSYKYKEKEDFSGKDSDSDVDEGVWIITEKNEIIFDKGTDDEEIWTIILLEAQKLVVKYKEKDLNVQCTFGAK